MNLALWLKLIQVGAVITMVAGMAGRWILLGRASQSQDIQLVLPFLSASAVFERMTVGGSNVVLLAGLVTAYAEGWPILGFLQGGRSNWVLVSLLLFLTLFPIIFLIFLPRGRVFAAALEQAKSRQAVTPELTAAFHDPLVRAAHIYEWVIVVIIIMLMVLKPF